MQNAKPDISGRQEPVGYRRYQHRRRQNPHAMWQRLSVKDTAASGQQHKKHCRNFPQIVPETGQVLHLKAVKVSEINDQMKNNH